MTNFAGSQIDHLNIAVPDLSGSARFYEAALAPLGITKVLDVPADPAADQLAMVGLGWGDRKPFFWLVENGAVGAGVHLAFTASSHAEVDAFHAAAVAAGATSLREPGLQPEYHADYYGAFVSDPNGIDLEAVCHGA
ncbi:VOC family protein [Umezawaea sp. Da 62-37]|uniref:VOC family protein n=1 Tax=Umezawaea sp. Da 62-37 TaxID=3075927 RepID=UPI0028F6DFAB|nr:VOC family protein [Umezawaea sp. Da 62-37]WNV88288.1 VOC family protein [Umezawaea sp. Da 62-37]